MNLTEDKCKRAGVEVNADPVKKGCVGGQRTSAEGKRGASGILEDTSHQRHKSEPGTVDKRCGTCTKPPGRGKVRSSLPSVISLFLNEHAKYRVSM